MNLISWIAEKVVTIVAQIIGGAVVTQVETEALKHHVNALGELEAEAKRQEDAGNPLLAQMLRDNGKRMAARTDFTSLEFAPTKSDNPMANTQPVKNISHGQPGKKKRGRPKKTEAVDPPAIPPARDEAQQ